MKIKIGCEEWYPVYSIVDRNGVEVDVSEETLARWTRIESDFESLQMELSELARESDER